MNMLQMALGIGLATTIAEDDKNRELKEKQRVTPVLDEIKAEIKSLSNANPSYWHSGDMVDRDEVLDIIDKYRESVDKG